MTQFLNRQAVHRVQGLFLYSYARCLPNLQGDTHPTFYSVGELVRDHALQHRLQDIETLLPIAIL